MNFPAIKKGVLAAACSLVITGLTPSLAEAAPAEARSESRQPNVLLIFADDLGYADAGFQNQSQDVETPNLNRLAADGAIMTAGYVTAPVSGPSRAGMMTGRYQQRFGYHDNIGPFVREEGLVQGLPLDLKTMADYFKDAGYRTGMVGKWHDGDPKEYWPHNRGFEDFFGFNNGAANYWVGPRNLKKYKNKPYAAIYRNDELVPEFDDYLTDRFGTEAVNYIEKRKDEPFFLFVPFNAIHGPLQAKKEDLDRFKHIEDIKRRTSVAMGYNMDKNIGRILDKLEEHELMEDTIIFFLSDNGGKDDDNYSWNHPLRGQKGTLWDGGIRVPFTVTWKGKIPAGQTLDEAIHSLDILTTSLAAAGIEPKEEWQLEGMNLLPYLKGEQPHLEDRFLFWDNPRAMAVRDRDWKLIQPNKLHKNGRPQLFKISDDIGEQNNLFNKYPEEAKRLQKAFDKWNADNEPSKWGWGRDLYPYSNGYRGRTE